MAVCTGCSLLCDDIELINEDGKHHVHNACRKGAGLFFESHDNQHMIEGKTAGLDKAIQAAAKILSEAKNPIVFGMDNSTSESQRQGLELSRSLGAVLDDTSSFCHGPTLELVLRGEVESCTLDDVRNEADVLVYWGCDPVNSHPRHLSRFSYFPRGKNRQRGYEEDRDALCFDVRPSDTAKVCGDGFLQIPLGGDVELMGALAEAAAGKLPKTSLDKKRVLALAQRMKKADYGVAFGGLGLLYSIGDTAVLRDFLNDVGLRFMPMIGHYNMRGLNQLLVKETGHTNRLSFADGVESGPEYSVVSQLRDQRPDAAIIVGSDLLSSMPPSISGHLAQIPTITLDPADTPTTRASKVAIRTGLAGVNVSGSAVRMDGVPVEFEAIEEGGASDEDVLRMIREAI